MRDRLDRCVPSEGKPQGAVENLWGDLSAERLMVAEAALFAGEAVENLLET